MGMLKRLRDMTIEDAQIEYERGFDCVCGDGRVRNINNLDRED